MSPVIRKTYIGHTPIYECKCDFCGMRFDRGNEPPRPCVACKGVPCRRCINQQGYCSRCWAALTPAQQARVYGLVGEVHQRIKVFRAVLFTIATIYTSFGIIFFSFVSIVGIDIFYFGVGIPAIFLSFFIWWYSLRNRRDKDRELLHSRL